MLSKLETNLRRIEEEWQDTRLDVVLDFELGRYRWNNGNKLKGLHNMTAGVHAGIIKGMPRLWFYKFWPQWLWVGWMADQVYNGGALWTALLSM